jgi:hypothetical protein
MGYPCRPRTNRQDFVVVFGRIPVFPPIIVRNISGARVSWCRSSDSFSGSLGEARGHENLRGTKSLSESLFHGLLSTQNGRNDTESSLPVDELPNVGLESLLLKRAVQVDTDDVAIIVD